MKPILNKYYVYLLINPSNNQPFYVGKGQNDRMYYHEKYVKKNKMGGNKHLYFKIKKILNSGNNVQYKKLFTDIDEKTAYKLEKLTIKNIGIKNLCNLTDGGEGCIGTEIIRYKQSISMKNRWKNGYTIDGLLRYNKYRKGKTLEEVYENEKAFEIKLQMSKRLKGKTYVEIYGNIENANKEIKKRSHQRIEYKISDEQRSKRGNNRRGKPATKGFSGHVHSETSKMKISNKTAGNHNPNWKIYKIKTPTGNYIEFDGKKKIIEFFSKYNTKNNLHGPNKISAHNLIKKMNIKNWSVVEIRKANINLSA